MANQGFEFHERLPEEGEKSNAEPIIGLARTGLARGSVPIRSTFRQVRPRPLDTRPLGLDDCGMETPDKRPWRRYLHLSLRSVLLLVLVLGSWLGWTARGVRVQREAVAAIERAGGWSAYDWEWEDGEKIRNGRPWGPNWLVDLIGIDYFGSVAVVVLPEAGSDAVLAHIGRLGRVQAVNLSMAPVTDAGVSTPARPCTA